MPKKLRFSLRMFRFLVTIVRFLLKKLRFPVKMLHLVLLNENDVSLLQNHSNCLNVKKHSDIFFVNLNNVRQYLLFRHNSLYLAQTRYKCAHCDTIIQDVANLSGNPEAEHCHRCYATPYDKETGTMSLQWLPLNVRSSKCQFDHPGPCLTLHTQRDRSQPKASKMDKRKMLQKMHKFGTTDNLSHIGGGHGVGQKSYDFDDLYTHGLVDGDGTAQLIHAAEQHHGDKVWKKLGKNLQDWHKNGKEPIYDKSFWDELLSSDSSDSPDESVGIFESGNHGMCCHF